MGGAAAGAAAGIVVGPVGTVIGAAVGAVVGGLDARGKSSLGWDRAKHATRDAEYFPRRRFFVWKKDEKFATGRTRVSRQCRSAAGRAASAQRSGRDVRTIDAFENSAKSATTAGERLATHVATFCGKMIFVWVQLALFAAWIFYNTLPQFAPHEDPFPFFALTFVVSL